VPDPGVNGDLLERFLEDGVPAWRLIEPREVFAVIGAAGKPERDADLAALAADGIPLRQRRGGGGAVILSPGQVVVALATRVRSPFANRQYAQAINDWVIEGLAGLGVRGVEQRGITDLAIGDRKILGTSIYRTRLVLFYQASLLVSNDLALFGRYLPPPYRQPDYRQGRDHESFCTTLVREGYRLDPDRVIEALEPVVRRRIGELAER
jgi:lipoate-protein ligase A